MKNLKLEDLEIEKMLTNEQLEVNTDFYTYLKEMNGTNGFSATQRQKLLTEIIVYHENIGTTWESTTKDIINYILGKDLNLNVNKKGAMNLLAHTIKTEERFVMYKFSLKLMEIKDLMLSIARMSDYSKLLKSKAHPLSLEYDFYSKKYPFTKRVKASLLTYIFFEKFDNNKLTMDSEGTKEFLESMKKDYNKLKEAGICVNQMFSLITTESVSQSIKTGAGSNYEDRIKKVLESQNIRDYTEQTHDKEDKSTEFDFHFTLNGKTYGLSAKRTVRERYKQFIKTSQMSQLDIMIDVTLGIDITEDKLKNIRQHGVYVFVADEVYNESPFMKKNEGIFPATQFTKETLSNLE
ncbi:PDDEXK family nuclease [Dactylococcopsis salina]|nr:type II restriction endonuclease [Dactylococcopsis salina]AFZ49532.1 restriction enzyme like protein [Dactylococcopsis salina PCC 8305]